jgi:hypothetical protein
MFSLFLTGCNLGTDDQIFQVLVSNESDLALTDQLVELDLALLEKSIPDSVLEKMVLSSVQTHPWQLSDVDGDGTPDKLLILTDLAAGEKKKISAGIGESPGTFTQRTQAEISVKVGGEWEDRVYMGGNFKNITCLRVPPEHTDHSFYIRYEGPGWESDRVGYRFYLDWRNAIDIFGKQTEEMVLQDVGQDGFDSYHEPADWGMDVLKVGGSLGIGSLGIWSDGKANRVAVTDSITCKIVASGPVYSEIETNYYGWQAGSVKTDLKSLLSISAGNRLTRHEVMTSAELDNLCTGIVIDTNARFIVPDSELTGWSYIATYGKQSLAGDNLGMAVFYRTDELIEITEDAFSKVVVLRPSDRKLTYYFMAAWEKELNGIVNEEEFVKNLGETVKMLDNAPSLSLLQ